MSDARIFAIGDIHGSLVALKTLLEMIVPTAKDKLIFLGDYINRGDDSKGVLDTLMNLPDSCQVVTIMGNHELMMLDGLKYPDAFNFWLRVGGDKTLQSFGLLPLRHECLHLPFHYISFLKNLKAYYETDDFIFCHASIFGDVPMSQQDDYGLRWRKLESSHVGHISGKKVVCGHTEQRSGDILVQGDVICIDTWAYGGGYLSALQITHDSSMTAYQANNQGQTRKVTVAL